jgi:hypothetical protein
MKVTIVALAKYPDIFDHFRKELDKFVAPEIRKLVVVDGNEIKAARGWEIVQGAPVFGMSANHNIGWRAVEPDSDILNFNDDVYFLGPTNPLEKLQELVYSESHIGCVSASVKIGYFANPIQCKPRTDTPISFVKTSSNGMATYVRRAALDEVGYFDESFSGPYSAEDADWTYRCNVAGWKVGIARDVHVKHGYAQTQSTSTSLRALKLQQLTASNKVGVERFKEKHGHFDVHGYWDWESSTSETPDVS